MAPTPGDRYEPLPGLLGLPGFLYRKLSPLGRRVAVVAGVLLLIGAGVATALLAPRIGDSKRETAERDRQEAARAAEERARRLRLQARPRLRMATGGATLAVVESAITADAARRARAGEFPTPPKHTDCKRLGVRSERVIISCTSVTTEIPSTGSGTAGSIGYPYRAAIAPDGRRFAFCRVSGQAAEGFLNREHRVRIPSACS